MSGAGVRTLLVWCPDWPVVAAEIVDGVPAGTPVAVLHANRVVACSAAARAEGVRRGLRRREAQGRCPQLMTVDHDPGRDARAFEPVVAAVEEVAVGVEVIRPGICALAARGPTRYFGGEEAAAERIVDQVAQACRVECQIGVADGVFAAGLAARAGRIVAPGQTRDFLADIPVEVLDRPALVDLLRRLGVRTLGDFAALPASDVLSRFGFDGALAHRNAAGVDHRSLAVRRPPPDLEVADTFDDPLERVDVAAFAARSLAERLHDRLAGYGLACTRLGIEALTADGQELHRVWRHDGMLTVHAIAERVRWQLDGWLSGTYRDGPGLGGSGLGGSGLGGSGRGGPGLGGPGLGGPGLGGPGRDGPARPTAGLVRLRLVPDGVLAHLGLQPGLWGDAGAERERAHRALSRVQGLLGPDAVVTVVLGGGRSADDQVRLVPWGDERPPDDGRTPGDIPDRFGTDRFGTDRSGAGSTVARVGGTTGKGRRRMPDVPPWPGRLPRPAPALVLSPPLDAVVQDAAGVPVGVSARLELTGAPALLVIGADPPVEIVGWAGPWPVDERWWAPDEARRRARFQLVLADGRALLVCLAAGRWSVEANYD